VLIIVLSQQEHTVCTLLWLKRKSDIVDFNLQSLFADAADA